jgi:hypothetical protein
VSIGALRRASDWETTSVPDIALHARAIAESLCRDLTTARRVADREEVDGAPEDRGGE